MPNCDSALRQAQAVRSIETCRSVTGNWGTQNKGAIRVNMTEPCIMNTLAQLTPVSWKNALVKCFSTQPLMKFTPKTLLSIYSYSSAALLFCFVFCFCLFITTCLLCERLALDWKLQRGRNHKVKCSGRVQALTSFRY